MSIKLYEKLELKVKKAEKDIKDAQKDIKLVHSDIAVEKRQYQIKKQDKSEAMEEYYRDLRNINKKNDIQKAQMTIKE